MRIWPLVLCLCAFGCDGKRATPAPPVRDDANASGTPAGAPPLPIAVEVEGPASAELEADPDGAPGPQAADFVGTWRNASSPAPISNTFDDDGEVLSETISIHADGTAKVTRIMASLPSWRMTKDETWTLEDGIVMLGMTGMVEKRGKDIILKRCRWFVRDPTPDESGFPKNMDLDYEVSDVGVVYSRANE